MGVLNIKLKGLSSVKSFDLQLGQLLFSSWSDFHLDLQDLQSTSGSVKVSTCPEYFKTSGYRKYRGW